MITAISIDDTRRQEMEVGEDDFLIKPYRSTDVVRVLSDGLAPLNLRPPEVDDQIVIPVRVNGIPPFVRVVVAAGTGGPSDIHHFFQSIDKRCPAEYFCPPAWSGLDNEAPRSAD